MSCLSLRFPVSARRAWKRFTAKLKITKLWKTQRSKGIKKPKNGINSKILMKKTAASSHKNSPFRNKLRRKRLPCKQLYFNKTTAPVYVDRLFYEPAVSELVRNFQPPQPTTAEEGGVKGLERGCAADDMWESLALASPLTDGIDERAEEFILRFRAEMELQETMAHGL
ncbi:hypothetical protein HS088_TW10G00909 [Tripterygium wilfordii]|uniref:Uncharacterized protein n=1 Tax=Tripterygium wilfordii TaxID=458696 RepID=A0A7J7D6G3_TRIWF|nr:hypothetical protein HS088_TW10G00909 [Tripterygium wilfordii]